MPLKNPLCLCCTTGPVRVLSPAPLTPKTMLAISEQCMVFQVVHHVPRDDMFEALACNGGQGDKSVIVRVILLTLLENR